MVFTHITVTPFENDYRGTKPVFMIASICGKMPSGRVLKEHISLNVGGYDVYANYVDKYNVYENTEDENDVIRSSNDPYDVAFATGIHSSDARAIFENVWKIAESIKATCFENGVGNRVARCNKYDTENPDAAVWEYNII